MDKTNEPGSDTNDASVDATEVPDGDSAPDVASGGAPEEPDEPLRSE